MVSMVPRGIAAAWTIVGKENNDVVTPARSMLAARILKMSLEARYVVQRGCGAG